MPYTTCPAKKADGDICEKRAKIDGLCRTHHKQRERTRVLEAQADAREQNDGDYHPEDRCTVRLKNHRRCNNEALSEVEGLCDDCHFRIQQETRDAPYTRARNKLNKLVHNNHYHYPYAQFQAVVEQARDSGLDETRLRQLQHIADNRWENIFYIHVTIIWRGFYVPERPLRETVDQTLREIHTWTLNEPEIILGGPRGGALVHDLNQHVDYLRYLHEELEFRNGPQPTQELGRLAYDRQNVHTGAVVAQMNEGLAILVAADPGPIPKGQEGTRARIGGSFASVLGKNPESEEMVLVKQDMSSMWKRSEQTDGTNYHKALRGLWAKISSFEGDKHKELVKRLWEECLESVGMCTQGHLARLTNVMVGYDEDFKPPAPIGTILQERMAEIAESDVDQEEKVRLARSLLVELKVPEEKHDEWISAL